MPDETMSGRRHRVGPWHEGVTIQRWRLGNFKSVQQADVELSPLTVLVGANSAGKSSLIQSILAVSQAARADSVSNLFPLNGGIVRLGTVDQNRYAGPGEKGSRPISFGAHFQMGTDERVFSSARARRRRMQPDGSHCHIDWLLTLGESPSEQSGQARIDGITFTVNYDHAADIEEDDPGPSRLHASARGTSDGPDKPQLQGTWSVGGAHHRLASVALRGGLPMSGRVERDLAEIAWEAWRGAYQMQLERATSYRSQQMRHARLEGQLSLAGDVDSQLDGEEAVRRIAGDILEAYRSEAKPRPVRINDQMRIVVDDEKARMFRSLRERYADDRPDLPPSVLFNAEVRAAVRQTLEKEGMSGQVPISEPLVEVSEPSWDLVEFLAEKVWYLGPLREDPRVVYQDSAEARNGYVGAKGEYLAAVLQSNGRRPVEVPLPHPKGGFRISQVSLYEALNRWIRFLEIGQAVTTSDRGRLGLELSIEQQHVDVPLDLTSVGTGVSQLLPVLVLCLRSPRGSLLLMEQPELHLNPGVQQRLADFLLAMAGAGRQVIVETHSEYLISRLRLRVADDESDRVRQTVGLLFAERTEGSTTYRQVETNEYGGLENWPVGFFDQSAEESRKILQAAVEKRRRRQASQ
jgi:predicted ATPase